jgi:hypothetical protein
VVVMVVWAALAELVAAVRLLPLLVVHPPELLLRMVDKELPE